MFTFYVADLTVTLHPLGTYINQGVELIESNIDLGEDQHLLYTPAKSIQHKHDVGFYLLGEPEPR
jgi:hypothetical protein